MPLCGGGHARIQRGGQSPGSCSWSLHPSGEQNFPDVSLVPHIPFLLACIQASPRTPWLPDPAHAWKSAAEQIRTFLGVGPSASGLGTAACRALKPHPCGSAHFRPTLLRAYAFTEKLLSLDAQIRGMERQDWSLF